MAWQMGRETVRTGIDLGTSSVKLVRGIGQSALETITHVGIEDWDPPGDALEETRASAALVRLLERLKLGKRSLGRVAAGASGANASLREVSIPKLSERELRRALPFEAKKHLALEGMESPCFDVQILGPAPDSAADGAEEMRVLLVGVPRAARDFPLRVLGRAGLEPEVIDLEPLSGINALLNLTRPEPSDESDEAAPALLDMGATQSSLHVVHREGGVVTRTVGRGAPPGDGSAGRDFASDLAGSIRETITFYRGRHRRDVERVFLAGGGALVAGIAEELQQALGLAVRTLDPLKGLAETARGVESVAASGARLVTAFGLCCWWDGPSV